MPNRPKLPALRHAPSTRAKLFGECVTELSGQLIGLRRGLRNGARVAELVEQIAGRRLEALHVVGGHLRSPILQAADGRKPSPLGGESRFTPGPAFMEAKHRIVVGDPEERAETPAHACWAGLADLEARNPLASRSGDLCSQTYGIFRSAQANV
jgi:hypothetical protein